MIELDLCRHCIETEIKRLHNRYVSLLLKADVETAEAENALRTLRNALDRLDFSRLRADFAQLAGNRRDTVTLLEDPAGRLKLTINHDVVDLAPYCKGR